MVAHMKTKIAEVTEVSERAIRYHYHAWFSFIWFGATYKQKFYVEGTEMWPTILWLAVKLNRTRATQLNFGPGRAGYPCGTMFRIK